MALEDPTARDRVWAAILDAGNDQRRFKVSDVRFKIDYEDRPSDETIRRVLRVATDLGVVSHRGGSQYYKLKEDL